MKRIILALALVAALPGCSLVGLPDKPADAADRTVLDEQAMLAIELGYKAARLAVETAVDAGVIKGQRALDFAEYDDKAYRAVQSVRKAYAAGNAQGYGEALGQARAAVTDLLSLIPSKDS